MMPLIWKTTILLATASMLNLALRRASAATRHLVWALALTGALALPLVMWLMPTWRVDFRVAAGAPALLALTAAAVPADRLDPMVLVWAGGAMVVLARLLVGMLALRWMVRRAKAFSGESWNGLLEQLRGQLGLETRVILLQSDRATMPMAWGLRRFRILLPAGAERWSAGLRRNVLLHELAHVKRGDYGFQLLAKLACALYWFHPLAWVAVRQLVRESERACDDQVLSAGAPACDYAGHLLSVARWLKSCEFSSWATVALGRRSQLEGRLLAILNPAVNRNSRARAATALLSAGFVAVLAPLAALRPSALAAGQPSPPGAARAAQENQASEQTNPEVIYKVNPQYTQEARDAGIEGSVELQIEIQPDGRSHDVVVLKGLDPGLDANAVSALEQWRFKPGTKNGKAVTVKARVTINFALR